MNVVRWGIVSSGKIASDFAKAISYTEGSEVRYKYVINS